VTDPPATQSDLAVLPVAAADGPYAAELAQRLELPLLERGTDPGKCHTFNALLVVGRGQLSLHSTGHGAPGPVVVDFGSAGMRHRRIAGARELLGKAVGQGKKPLLRVLDATAGLGTDAFVLADLGCELLLCEREPVIAELLRAGMKAAASSGDPWLQSVVQRMTLQVGDARELLQVHVEAIDVIYLDPMFPPRRKSAAVKKEMALFQRLLDHSNDPQDADALLDWAQMQDVARVVVKRPAKAPEVAGLRPSHAIFGKSVRYDVYVHRKLL
jgi:16S rRNA (guanine1516-N2)-methyltransferase